MAARFARRLSTRCALPTRRRSIIHIDDLNPFSLKQTSCLIVGILIGNQNVYVVQSWLNRHADMTDGGVKQTA